MSIKLTESRLKQIVLEEMSSLKRSHMKKRSSLKEMYGGPDTAEILKEACVTYVEKLMYGDPSGNLPEAVESMLAEVKLIGEMIINGEINIDVGEEEYSMPY